MPVYGFNRNDVERIGKVVKKVEKSTQDQQIIGRKHKKRSTGGAGGTTEYFAVIKSGSGLTYTVDIYDEFATDMTFSGITPFASDVTAKVPDGMLDSTFSLSADEVYMVAEYNVNGKATWVMTTRAGIS